MRLQASETLIRLRRPDLNRESITLTLAEPTPSQNLISGRGHWTGYTKLKERWEKLILEALSAQHLVGFYPGERYAHVAFLRVAKGTLDEGNLEGGCKPVLDLLRARGLIVDDNARWLAPVDYSQRRCARGEQPHTVLTIRWTSSNT